jgi:nitrous oxidase accessory protein NosD
VAAVRWIRRWRMRRAILIAALLGLVAVSLLSLGISIETGDQPACTVTVQPGQSIQAAIDGAHEGAVVCLAEGTWEESIKIQKSLELHGMGLGRTVIHGSLGGYPTVWIMPIESDQPISAVVEGLEISEGAYGELPAGAPLWIMPDGISIVGSAEVTIADCTVSNHISGIAVFGEWYSGGAPKVTISATVISKNHKGIDWWGSEREDHVYLQGPSRLTITASTISENDGDGIQLFLPQEESGQEVRIEGNMIENNAGCGVLSYGGIDISGQGNRMFNNGADLCGNVPASLRIPLAEAVEQEIVYPDALSRYATLQEAVDALLPGGRLVLDYEYEAGLTIAKPLRIEARKSRLGILPVLKARRLDSAWTAPVISLIGGARLELSDVEISGGGEESILLGGDAQAEVTNCTITGGWDAIYLLNSASATITDSRISKGGIELQDSAQGVISRSSQTGGFTGLHVFNQATVAVTDCYISHNRLAGIWLEESAHATITNSHIFWNDSGIYIGDWAESVQVRLDANEIAENGGYGVVLCQQSCCPQQEDWVFAGFVAGGGNRIHGNGIGAVCPPELDFLMMEEGGEYP